MKKRHVVIVGGGASGLLAAISAAHEGADVTIVEQKDKLGKKILSTGNGRCNLTNEYMNKDCFRGDDISVVSKVLKQFGYQQTISFFEELGVILKERQGYIYPITEQAGTILDVLCMEIKQLGVRVMLNQSVVSISKSDSFFQVKTSKERLTCNAVILATGGKAASVLGSDGSGYTLAKSFGHRISPVVPALVQLVGKGHFYKQVSGVRTQAKVSLYIDEKLACEDTGELQLTNYGISGIPVFQVSRYAAKALYEKRSVMAELDLLPSLTDDEFEDFLSKRIQMQAYKTAEEFLTGIFNKKLIGLLLKASRIDTDTSICDVTEEQLKKLLHVSKHFRIEIQETNGFEQAQVCAGGVCTTEVHPQTMESMYIDGLYFTGELLDIDGMCGGYNLQWAWSTGFIAGKHAAKGNKYDSNQSTEVTTEP